MKEKDKDWERSMIKYPPFHYWLVQPFTPLPYKLHDWKNGNGQEHPYQVKSFRFCLTTIVLSYLHKKNMFKNS